VAYIYYNREHLFSLHALVEKGLPYTPFSPQPIRSATNGHNSPGSIENVGREALVPVQMCPLVPV
jgi:hypothetical protein